MTFTPRIGERPLLHQDVRRSDPAELLGVFSGAVFQSCRWDRECKSREAKETDGVRRMRMMNEFEAQVLSDSERAEDADERPDGRRQRRPHRRAGAAHGAARAELAARQGISGGGERAVRGDRSGGGSVASAVSIVSADMPYELSRRFGEVAALV